jgi:hypothetical protein
MSENKIDPDNDSPIEIMTKIQEVLKPLGYEIHGYNENPSSKNIILHLDYEHRFVPVPL